MNYFSDFDHFYDLKYDCATTYAKVENPRGMSSPHHHNDYEIYFLMSGNRKYFIQDKIYTLQPNQIVIFKPNIPHQVTVNMNIPYERTLLYVTPHLFSAIINENQSLKEITNTSFFNLDESDFKKALEYIKKINQEFDRSDSFSQDVIKGTIAELLVFICRHNNISNILVDKMDFRIQSSIDFIVENYSKSITLSDAANVACMSISHFSRVFHQMTSFSFKEYLNKIRIEKSCELLKNTKYSIAEIAQLVGYSTESYYGYIFKLINKISPLAYRNASSKNID